MRLRFLCAFIATLFLVTILGGQSKPQAKSTLAGSALAVIAPSVSTSMMARTILAELHASETTLKRADYVLVVVRSSLSDPLNFSYESVCELKRDAENQLNIAGPKYHVYIYALDDDLRASRQSHKSFAAED
jgi:hypothetical protein